MLPTSAPHQRRSNLVRQRGSQRNLLALGMAALVVLGTISNVTAATAVDTGQAQPSTRVQTQPVSPEACPVEQGTLSWGVKESFRAYVMSTIAKGSVSAIDGATYETPLFTWSGANGALDPDSETGRVGFVGSALFSGHAGQLDLTFSNPVIEFASPSEGYLVLDVRSRQLNSEQYLDSPGTRLGKLEFAAPPTVASGAQIAMSDVPVTLTAEGVVAFANFYMEGEKLDPLSFDFTMGDCVAEEVVQPAPTVTPTPAAEALVSDDESSREPVLLWLWIVLVVVVAGGATVGIILWRRRANR
ncbi:HtaA domain-containing protein [Lysinibacter sp. HNR]|uniref:HtaA domain-containing protein n=1 Tax=Lysinibacter sp. HNR TaxID=3031408 RepID=UPI002435AD20|nr:HtaA domain-containing protein [Lysinibacter sp. HNR]WGD36998.1 HtaA domain-containing protein [Lysinibacter sp. HNR]